MRHILTLLFEQLHSLWYCRNAQTHGADQELQDKIKREQLTIRVTALYNQLPNLLVHDRQAFESLTQDDLLSGPTSSISTWLRIAEPTIQRCLGTPKSNSIAVNVTYGIFSMKPPTSTPTLAIRHCPLIPLLFPKQYHSTHILPQPRFPPTHLSALPTLPGLTTRDWMGHPIRLSRRKS